MTYATQQDLIDRFGEDELIQISDLADPPFGAIDAIVVARALTDTDDLIDAYLTRRYRLPLAEIPRRLVKVAADIARHHLHKDLPTETVENNFKEAMAFLRDVAAGRAEVDIAGEDPAPPERLGVEAVGSGRTFSAETLRDY